MAVSLQASLEYLSCMAVSFSSISGTPNPPILHGRELFKPLWNTCPAGLWAFQASLGHPILHPCELCKHRWDNLSCMAASDSSNSGLHGCDMAVNFSSISGILILHGCELSSISGILILHGCDMAVSFSSFSGILILNGCELFKHLWDSLWL